MPYITRIEVFNHYKLPDFAVDFATTNGKPFRHLILTGPNGSGKTTILTQLARDITLSKGGTGTRHERTTAANMIPVHVTRPGSCPELRGQKGRSQKGRRPITHPRQLESRNVTPQRRKAAPQPCNLAMQSRSAAPQPRQPSIQWEHDK